MTVKTFEHRCFGNPDYMNGCQSILKVPADCLFREYDTYLGMRVSYTAFSCPVCATVNRVKQQFNIFKNQDEMLNSAQNEIEIIKQGMEGEGYNVRCKNRRCSKKLRVPKKRFYRYFGKDGEHYNAFDCPNCLKSSIVKLDFISTNRRNS